MKLTLTTKDIIPILIRIKLSKQIVPDWFFELTPEEIAHCFNGVGADSTWKPLRVALSWIFRWATRSVVIHDVTWTYVEKYEQTEEDFYKSNVNLKKNARIELKEHTSRYNPLYYYRYYNSWRAQKACDLLGRGSWNDK